jgi:hypothetical protein
MALCDHLIERSTCGDCSPRPGGKRGVPVPGRGPAGYGPWFPASYDGECSGCGGDILPGDKIRADGQGGWLDEDCGDPDLDRIQADIARDAGKPTAGEFMSGAGGPGYPGEDGY